MLSLERKKKETSEPLHVGGCCVLQVKRICNALHCTTTEPTVILWSGLKFLTGGREMCFKLKALRTACAGEEVGSMWV